MRAALYARFSTDKQSSTADQLRVCRTIAERHGFEVVVEYSDEAISGGTANRPGYQQLLAAARAGEIDIIVAEDTSRLWRNLAEQSPREAELRDLGVHVVTHDLDTRTEASGWMGPILGASAQQFRQEIALEPDTGAERPVLWAILDPRPVALEASAGGGVNRSGSGGRIWSRLRVPLPARRFSAQPPRR